MRSTNDPIAGLKQKLLEWGVTSEEELKTIDKDARSMVDEEVAAAEAMEVPDATPKVLFEDIYVRGSEPQFLRGRTPEENFYYDTSKPVQVPKSPAQTRGLEGLKGQGNSNAFVERRAEVRGVRE